MQGGRADIDDASAVGSEPSRSLCGRQDHPENVGIELVVEVFVGDLPSKPNFRTSTLLTRMSRGSNRPATLSNIAPADASSVAISDPSPSSAPVTIAARPASTPIAILLRTRHDDAR